MSHANHPPGDSRSPDRNNRQQRDPQLLARGQAGLLKAIARILVRAQGTQPRPGPPRSPDPPA